MDLEIIGFIVMLVVLGLAISLFEWALEILWPVIQFFLAVGVMGFFGLVALAVLGA